MSADALRKLQVPRWVQLVGLPLVVIGAWQFMSAVSHAVFIFVLAALIAILLNPVVRAFTALRVPRTLAVFLVYGVFAFVIVGALVIASTVIADQVSQAASAVQDEFQLAPGQSQTPAEQKVDELQRWLNRHGLERVDVRKLGDDALNRIKTADLEKYSGRAVDIARGFAIGFFEGVFNGVLVIVVSIYMLLDAHRLSAFLRRPFPGARPEDDLIARCERALLSYVRGQLLVSLVIGASAGAGMWLLGVTGVFPDGQTYALAFAAWAAITEIIPYVGPWLGAIPPLIVALTHSPGAAIAVVIVFLIIHQIEGHIVIPKLMGGAVGVHPLVVIFSLLAAAQLYGFAGVLVAMPLVAVGREVWQFTREHVELEKWRNADIPVPVSIEPSAPEPDGPSAPA
jgi:predicted PurR-regulated permease PerM